MGFSLEQFIEQLIIILDSDKKDSKKVKELAKAIIEGKRYAKDCGQLN